MGFNSGFKGLIYYSKSALQVSGVVFAHHQEHLTVFTVAGSFYPSCCRLVSWMLWNWTMWFVRRVYTPHKPLSSVSTETMWFVRRLYTPHKPLSSVSTETMWFVRRVYTPHKPHNSVSTHPGHQPAATWVNTTSYCKYSQVLLMMGENIARNM